MRIRLLALSLIAVTWLGCQGQTERPNPPTIAVDHDTIDFNVGFYGGTYLTTTDTQSIIIRNDGIEELDISGAKLSGDSVFTMQGPSKNALGGPDGNGNDVSAVTVFFKPTEAKAYTGTLTIHSNSSVNPDLAIPITGNGVNPPDAGM